VLLDGWVVNNGNRYFFDSNSAVDGCANKKEPGYEHFEWLRIQLQMLRDRGMKAILTGHVPPARTDSKSSWDETCWQKFALWQKQYSDVITGSLFGHMNVDHFMVHDSRDLHKDTEQGKMGVEFLAKKSGLRESLLEDGEVTVQSVSDYLVDLGKKWAKLPSPPKSTKKGGKKSIYEYTDIDEEEQVSIWQWIGAYITGSKKGAKAGPDKDNDKEKKRKFWDEMGGKYGERFSIVQSAPSVVPNYFPTLRVVSYNISGLGHIVTPARPPSFPSSHLSYATADQVPIENPTYSYSDDARWIEEINQVVATKQKEKKERNAKKPARKWRFRVPHSPSKSAPPGPAYSNQALTLLSYTQYFANLTHINNDFVDVPSNDSLVEGNRWKEGKHKKHQGKQPRPEPHPREFKFEVEYDTKHDERFKLKDLTVSSYVDLARRIGQDKCGGAAVLGIGEEDGAEEEDGDVWADGKKKKGKHGKKHKPKKNGPWFTFVKRAFVGSMDPHDVEDIFGVGAAGVEADLDVDEVLEL
jgi:endopolyphosphatase